MLLLYSLGGSTLQRGTVQGLLGVVSGMFLKNLFVVMCISDVWN